MAKLIPSDGTFTGKSLVGQRFRRWTVIEFAGWHLFSGNRKEAAWKCQCSCGNIGPAVSGTRLKRGESKSCGCWNQRMIGLSNLRHGLSAHKLYNVHQCMMARCYNPNNSRYHRYGGRGIKVCNRWKSFINFARDTFSTWKEGLQMDRIDNDKGYNPKNFRWVTNKQNCNNRETCRWVYCEGKHMSVTDWATQPGAQTADVILGRLNLGWRAKEAIYLPLKGSLAWWSLGIKPRGQRSAEDKRRGRPGKPIKRYSRVK